MISVAMAIPLKLLRSGGSSFTVEDGDGSFYVHRNLRDAVNFDLIARRLLNEPSEDYVVFARPDGFGGYDSVHIIPLTDEEPETAA